MLPISGCILWRPLHVAYCTWRGLLYSDWHSFTHRGRRQVIFNYQPGPSWVSGVLTDVFDMSWGKHSFLICAFGHDFQKPSNWVTMYAHLDNAGPPDPNEWKYGIFLLLKKLWEPGYWAMRQVVRAKSFTCFTLHRLVRFCLLVLVFCLFWGGVLFVLFCLVWLADQSVRPCYQSMTILA